MTTPNLSVTSISHAVDHLQEGHYDLFLVALGYEQRARFIASNLRPDAGRKVAIAFKANLTLSFEENLTWFQANQFEILDVDDDSVRLSIERVLEELNQDSVNVLVDVSSFSRVRIAGIASGLLLNGRHPVNVDFLYAPAEFTPPTDDWPTVISEPILDDFVGWPDSSQIPTAAVFGLGYESDRAIGTADSLDPRELFVFIPSGEDKRYDRALEKANREFLLSIPTQRRVVYPVGSPFDCFQMLESLVYGLGADSRVVIVPFGPKIFVVCSLLVAVVHKPHVTVWHVSAGSYDLPVDRKAKGTIYGLQVGCLPDLESDSRLVNGTLKPSTPSSARSPNLTAPK